jgi:hypothetical protein
MRKKTSNLQVIQQQTGTEREQLKGEESWKLTRSEITARARALRVALETYRSQLEGMSFDVVAGEVPWSVQTPGIHLL